MATPITITEQDTRVDYEVEATPDDTFDIPFEFFETSDIRVSIGGVEQTGGFTVTGTSVQGGFSDGTLTLDQAVSNTIVSIWRDIPLSRTSVFPTSGEFSIVSLNTQLARIVAMIQQENQTFLRALRLPEPESGKTNVLPKRADRSGKFLSFDADGNPTAVVGDDASPGTADAISYTPDYTGASTANLRDYLDAQSFPTYTELLDVTSTEAAGYRIARVRGRSSAGDGGEGDFDARFGDFTTEVSNDAVDANNGEWGGIYVPFKDDVDNGTPGASGAWGRQVSGPYVYAIHYGVSASASAADNSAGLEAIATSYSAQTKTLVLPEGVIAVQDGFDVPRQMSLVGAGQKNTVIDASGSSGSFSTAVVETTGSSPSQISDLSASPSRGSTRLTFANSHNLSVGDVGLIWNPTDGSYSGFRPTYRAGEFFKVANVVSSTEIDTERPLYAGYTAGDVNVYVISDPAQATWRGFSVNAPGTGVGNDAIDAISVELAHRFFVDDIGADGSGDKSFRTNRCFGFYGTHMDCEQNTDAGGVGTYYGWAIANCQEVYASNGRYVGYRHGTTTGGGDVIGPICRDIHISDSIITRADPSVGAIAAADWHGNTEWSSYRNISTHGGGINIAGNHNSITDCRVNARRSALYGREVLGLDHVASNIEAFVSDDPDAVSTGLIDLGGNRDVISSDTVEGGYLKFRNIKIDAPNSTGVPIFIRNRGYTGGNWGYFVDGLEISVSSIAGGAVINEDILSGDDASYVSVLNIFSNTGDPIDSESTSSASYRQTSAAGRSSVTTNTGDNVVTKSITFPQAFANTPSVNLTSENHTTGGDRIVVYADSVTKSGFEIEVRTADGNNFSSSLSVTVAWQAVLSEF